MSTTPQAPPPPRTGHTGLAIASFVLALIGFLLGILPFVGALGTLGLVLAIVELVKRKPRRDGLAIAAIVLGVVATGGVGIWTWIFVEIASSPSSSSCPHLYAFDGESYRLDADPVSGAIFAGAERDDLDRLESLRPVDGEYRLRVVDELEELDHIDRLELRVVDHAEGVEVLPTQDGHLVSVRDAATPVRATDRAGRDVLGELRAADGRVVTGAARSDAREAWTVELPRPASDRALLVVRGHNTPFAEEALSRYLADMGQGAGPLMEWAASDCGPEMVAEEIERLGLSLHVRLSSSGSSLDAPALQPVGPAIARSQALPISLPRGSGPITIRLEATPRFWEIDQVQLAPVVNDRIAVRVLRPRRAVLSTGEDATRLLARTDGRRVVLDQGQSIDVRFAAPPPPPTGARTVIASVRGFYQARPAGRVGIAPAVILGHQLGLVSLPSFAAHLGRR